MGLEAGKFYGIGWVAEQRRDGEWKVGKERDGEWKEGRVMGRWGMEKGKGNGEMGNGKRQG